MDDGKSPQVVTYMLRHLLTANITDPLSESSRGIDEYTQYFSGNGVVGQINYLERKPIASSSGKFNVYVGGALKYPGTDYTLDRTAMTITWLKAVASGNDNIKVVYYARKPWIYDDHPNPNIKASWPRITIQDITSDYETFGLDQYTNYSSGPGDLVTMLTKIIVRNRSTTNEPYAYSGLYYKNMDLVNAISESIKDYFQNNRKFPPWKFWDWRVVRAERIRTEEDMGIFRKDLDVEVMFFDKST